jgi:transcriptional regulator with XRE-family HTH domain
MPNTRDRPDPNDFADRLNALLRLRKYGEHGDNQRLAREFSVSDATASNWRNGVHLPTPKKARTIAQKLKADPDWLYWGEGDPPADLHLRVGRASVERAPKASESQGAATDEIFELQTIIAALIASLSQERQGEAARLRSAMKNEQKKNPALRDMPFLNTLIESLEGARRAG